jgi:hypothetical protein
MAGMRFDDSAAAFVVLAAMALFFVVANGFILHRHLTWAPRVRRLLEQDGFHVRHLERRWLTRGPFPDMRPPGLKHHKEWLVRVVAEDRELRPRAGWVRWHRKWPWEAADKWAVRWDEEPWSGQPADARSARKPGLSTAVFMALILLPALAGLGLGAYLLGRGIDQPQPRNPSALQQAASAPAPTPTPGFSTGAGYEIRCRGGDGAFRLQQLSGGPRSGAGGQVWVAQMSLEFRASPLAAGPDGAGLIPGTCAWIDRPLNDLEPRSIRFEAPATHSTSVPHSTFPTPGLSPDVNHLKDLSTYWSFFAYNTNQGFLQATSHRRWDPPAPPPSDAAAGTTTAPNEIVQRFVCERSYQNFAWGYQHSGIYVDREGSVYRFPVEDRARPGPLQQPNPTEAEMEAKFGQSVALIGRVPADELLAMFRLIPAAAKGGYSERVSASRDRGAFVTACYLFDAAEKRYREVELDVKGDWEYRNLAPEAETLTKWLASLDRPLEKN